MSKAYLILALALLVTTSPVVAGDRDAPAPGVPATVAASKSPQELKSRIIRARVQPRPGAEVKEVDMKVHPSPTALASVAAGDAPLGDDDLVLGVVVAGRAMAYPIRYLSMYEIVDDRVGGTPIAPSW